MPTLYDNFSQVRQYIDENNTSYVTKTELANASYVTSTALENASYATTTYVADYVAEHGGGGSTVIDENIIPNTNKTYTLGTNDYQYSATYTYFVGAYNSGILVDTAHGFVFNINGNNRFTIANSTMRPIEDNYFKFGSDSQRWKSTYVVDTYTSNLYSPSLVLSYSYNSIDNASNTQINFKVNQWNRMKLTNTALMPSTNNGIKLGDSGAQWSSTYVRDLYLNGTNIEDRFTYLVWTGTAAEYELLPDYTTYQFYLIQES